MTRKTVMLLVLAALTGLSACEADRMSEKGFSLPEGNALNGKEAFVYMHCIECHTVVDEEFPTLALAEPPYVELGGKVTRVKTYGELVTAIINPSHKLARGYPIEQVTNDSQSKMPIMSRAARFDIESLQECSCTVRAHSSTRFEFAVNTCRFSSKRIFDPSIR